LQNKTVMAAISGLYPMRISPLTFRWSVLPWVQCLFQTWREP
jgi:hypothetical protein